MGRRILIIDDERNILTSLEGILTDEGYHVFLAESGEEALKIIREDPPYMVLLDIWMPGLDGIEVLKRIRDEAPSIIVIMMSGHGTIETAVKSTKLGAYDFIEKPISMEKLTLLIRHAFDQQRLEEENIALKGKLEKGYEVVGKSQGMVRLMEQINVAGPTNSRVLITGENGTGKELVARAIHRESQRADKPFVAVNCAAIPDTLIESELFGYEKGAFTGAAVAKKGKFEQADEGTLFLDEVGDMSLATQAKVLRVLQEQEFQRLGGNKKIRVDIRVIAASNKNLEEEIRKGNFREDLFYRLNVIPLTVPPLRERREDIPILINHFVSLFSQEYTIGHKNISTDAMDALCRYDWPGNVRELKNIIERLVIMVPSSTINLQDISFPIRGNVDIPQPIESDHSSLREAREAFEKVYISKKLKENDWNISKTAEVLKIDRTYLYRRIKALNIKEEV